MTETETFAAGPPTEFLTESVSQLSASKRRRNDSLEVPLEREYGLDLSKQTAAVAKKMYSAVDSTALLEAVQALGLDEADHEKLLGEEDADLSDAMDEIDRKLSYALAPRSKDASKVTSKKHRESVYIPELVLSEGDVFMAKTLSTTDKVRIAWDLDDSNEVCVVDDYKWGELLGWKKLKHLPHGKNKIREELGDQLSDDVLDTVAPRESSTSNSTTSSSSSQRTRTKPTDELLNIAPSSGHNSRIKKKAKAVKESFEDDGYIGSEYKQVEMLVLFPTTADRNLSDHYWLTGKRGDGSWAAVANCNKGTYEYLNDCDNVWHIEEYIEQASEYEFATNEGRVSLDAVDVSNLVLHVVEPEMRKQFLNGKAIENIPEVLPEYVDNQLYRAPDFPHSDDILYAPVTKEDVFWMRPELREMNNPADEDAIILYASNSPRNVGNKTSVSSDYKLYARARLPEWDFECTELETLDGAAYSIDLDEGGYELIETLAKLHDQGVQPFSETPQARWSQ
jgi:hypothetical protein